MQQRRREKQSLWRDVCSFRAKPKSRFPGNYSKNRISFLQYKGRRLCWQHESEISPSQGNNARRPPEMLRRSSLTCNHYGNTPVSRAQGWSSVCPDALAMLILMNNTSTHIPGWRIEWERLTERERRERKKVAGCNGRCWMLMVGTSGSGADVISLVQMSCDPADTPWTNSHTTDVAMSIKETNAIHPENDAV